MRKVCILMPSYNSEKYIQRSISSILRQTYKNWNLIIQDDASTDNSIKILKKFKSKKIKIYFNKKNLGQQRTRNILLNKSKEYYTAWIDSDDKWKKNKLEKQINFLEKNNLDICYTNYLININKKKYNRKIPPYAIFENLIKENFIGQSTVIYKSNLKKYKFRKNVRMDYDLWLRMLKKKKIIYGIEDNLVEIYLRKNSQSSSKIKNLILNFNMLRNSLKISLFKSLFYYLPWQIFNSLKKRRFYFF